MRRDLLAWELRWLAVEVAGIALGLVLMFSRLEELSAPILFGTLAMSGAVRYRHYTDPKTGLLPRIRRPS